MYNELAALWPMMSGPEEYRHEAGILSRLLLKSCSPSPRTMLDLGSGGGNCASHLKSHFVTTLVDLSPHMLSISRQLNPECEHIEGDMRSVRLGRLFDAVLVHDSLCHMTSKDDLVAAMATAFEHCRPGGVALFVPDEVHEAFTPRTDHGGKDATSGGLRYVQWMTDPDSSDTTILVDFGILIRDETGSVRALHERQTHGLFARRVWLQLLGKVGFRPRVVRNLRMREMFLARRPVS
jgi:SAM-dependent methyltransferase